MLRSVVSYAVNRLCLLVLLLFLAKTYGPSNDRTEDILKDWIDNASPFEKIARALR